MKSLILVFKTGNENAIEVNTWTVQPVIHTQSLQWGNMISKCYFQDRSLQFKDLSSTFKAL